LQRADQRDGARVQPRVHHPGRGRDRREFARKENALFLGCGLRYPIRSRSKALKLKEISYIRADAYPAGELKVSGQ
jgi:fructoselysine-6-P-deglycase FrlB-like protein